MAKPDTAAVAYFDTGYNPGRLIRSETRTLTGFHELAILDFLVDKKNLIFPAENSWVTVQYGRMPQWSKTFYGYVNHFERVDDSSVVGAHCLRIFCVGTSKPMNAMNPGQWNGVTGSFIARTFAERYALRSVISKSTTTLNWAQGVATDFATLRTLAQRDGSLFWVSGATLYYVDPSKRLQTAANSSVKTFYRSFPVGANHTDTLFDMRLVAGSDAPGIGAPQVTFAYGFDSKGTLIKGSSVRAYKDAGLTVPSSTAIHPGMVGSAAEAESVTSARLFSATWAELTANVRSEDSPVYVGDVVDLAGSGVDPSLQGRWFVSGTTDVLTYIADRKPFRYSMNLTLTRNQSGSNVTTATKNMTGANPIVPAVWVGNKWQSKTLETVYV